MVNRPLPSAPAGTAMLRGRRSGRSSCKQFGQRRTSQNAIWRAFAQILGKLFFLELSENLQRILFDYAQKRTDPANTAFNAAC
jgi:hypothetical protein